MFCGGNQQESEDYIWVTIILYNIIILYINLIMIQNSGIAMAYMLPPLSHAWDLGALCTDVLNLFFGCEKQARYRIVRLKVNVIVKC